jgi:hypothetical protein
MKIVAVRPLRTGVRDRAGGDSDWRVRPVLWWNDGGA